MAELSDSGFDAFAPSKRPPEEEPGKDPFKGFSRIAEAPAFVPSSQRTLLDSEAQESNRYPMRVKVTFA